MKMHHSNFGIVQGRLTKSRKLQQFPKNWEKEFYQLKKVNLNFIELLDERKKNNKNPLSTDDGFLKIDNILQKSKALKYSVCSDYIIDNNLFTKNNLKTISHVERLLKLSMKHKYKVFILPLLEASSITKKNFTRAVNILKNFDKIIRNSQITICLETILSGKELTKLLKTVNSKKIKCVFDTGNRILKSQSLEKEIILLKEYITHVHLKDKNKKNQNVILGTGEVNFLTVFAALKKINYKGNFVFETNRGLNPIKTAIYNKSFCEFFIRENY
jgi:sugar phosphate isomerase/epimerase